MLTRLQYLSRRLFNLLTYLPRTLSLVWQASSRWTAVWIALLILQGALPAALVYLTKSLVDSLVAVGQAGGTGRDLAHLRPVLGYAALVAGLLLLMELLRSLTNFVRAAQAELLKDHLSALIQRKSVVVDFEFYEQPEYHDHLHRARSEAGYRPIALLESLGGLLQGGITLGAMLLVIAPYGWWLPLALGIATLPPLLVVMTFTLRRYEWQRRITEDERRAWYYDWVITSAETAAEVRLFGLGGHFQNACKQLRGKLRGQQLQLAKEQGLAEFAAALLAMLMTGAALAWAGWQTLQGAASLGTLALFYQAFSRGQQVLRSLLSSFGELYSNGLFLSDLFEFLDLQPQIIDADIPGSAVLPGCGSREENRSEHGWESRGGSQPGRTALPGVKEGIEFDEVTFCYPGSERAALNGFSLTIPAGQITAIVGLNGAGKTTLIKLLCRLYDPASGSITIDGVDLRQMRLEDLRRQITVLFQHPVHYNATIAENIRLGAIDDRLTADQVQLAAEDAGAAPIINRLPEKYETLLGKWFSTGAELSTGEWQRLALARAFVRQAPIVLLDEPTSAMDSWAEADWLRRLRRAMAGRTVILITHRFTTAMQADRIHLMDGGRVTESGTHWELLALGGRYAESWTAQMGSVANDQRAN